MLFPLAMLGDAFAGFMKEGSITVDFQKGIGAIVGYPEKLEIVAGVVQLTAKVTPSASKLLNSGFQFALGGVIDESRARGWGPRDHQDARARSIDHAEQDPDGEGAPVSDEDEATHTIPNAFCSWHGDKVVRIESAEYTGFVPQSVIHDDSEVFEKGHRGKLIVKGWWAERNKLI